MGAGAPAWANYWMGPISPNRKIHFSGTCTNQLLDNGRVQFLRLLDHWRSQDFWLGGPANFHHWLRLPWTILVTLGLPTIGTENTGRIKPSAEITRCGAPKARRSRRRRRRGGGVGSGEGLCPSPENFSNFCLEIACYSAFWKQFFRLDSFTFYWPNRNTNTTSNELMLSSHTHKF